MMGLGKREFPSFQWDFGDFLGVQRFVFGVRSGRFGVETQKNECGEVCRTTNHFQSTSHSHVRVFFFSVRKVPKIWWCIHSLVDKFNILPTKNSREISKKERDHLSLQFSLFGSSIKKINC